MSKHTLSDIFANGFETYLEKYGPVQKEQYHVAHCIEQCRTAALGGHIHTCDKCGESVPLYNSCSNRHCPHCQAVARQRWIDNRMTELLPVSYFHVVFTIPHELNPFALRNKQVFYSILFKSVKETMLTLAENSKWLGASIGFIAVLHTWGQNLMDHPHIHCIVPAGGLSRDGKHWISCKDFFLFPFPAMRKLFMAKVLDYFKKAVSRGEIVFAGSLGDYTDKKVFDALVTTLYKKKWVIYVKQSFASPAAVVKYLGNYTHRTAISEKRLVNVSPSQVTFRYKDYKEDGCEKLMTLDTVELIRRFMLHVLPKGFMRIRHYGYLSSRGRAKKLPQCAEIFSSLKKNLEKRKEKKPWYVRFKELYGVDPRICKKCGKGLMVKADKIEPVRFARKKADSA